MKKISKETKDRFIEIIKFLIVVFCISFFSLIPYHNDVMPYGHDLGYHLNRINEIANGLNINTFPVLIHAGLLDNIGYANGLFYPQIFLYIPAILMSKFGLLLIPSYKVFMVIITFFTFLSMYYSTKVIFKKKEIGWIAAILYVFSLWRIIDIFVRGALGEVLAFTFFPLVIAGLYNVIYEKDNKWYLIVFGLCGVAYSHLLSFLFTIGLVLAICLLSIDKILKDKKVFLRLLLAAIISVLISLAFFGPMLEQKFNDVYNVDGRTLDTSEEVDARANSLKMALSSRFSYGYAENSTTHQDGMSEGIGTLIYLFAGLILFRKKLNLKNDRFEIMIFFIGIIVAIFTTTLIPWDKLTFLTFIQFPFRFNFISILLLSMVGSNSFYEVLDGENKRNLCIVMSIVIMIVQAYVISNIDVNFDSAVQTYEDLTQGFDREVGRAEYLPDGTIIWDLDLYNINDKENYIDFNQVGTTITFEYDRDDIDFEFNVPLVYYKGYQASITTKDGEVKKLECLEYDNKHVLIKSNERLIGTVKIEYKLTTIQIISYLISSISFGILIVYLAFIKIKDYKNKEKLLDENK